MSQGQLPNIIQAFKDSDGPIDVSGGWAQGRALYGGLVGALAAEGMAALLDEPLPIRSFMGSFVAPAPETGLSVDARILRQGRAVVQARADLVADGQVCFTSSAAFGKPREGVFVPHQKPFNPAPKDSVPSAPDDPRRPKFLSNFEIRWTGGGIPMSGSGDMRTAMWVRHRANMDAHPLSKLVAMADMPPPIVLAHYNGLALASSLSWSLEFVTPPEDMNTEWFYLEFELEAAANGYSVQTGNIWGEDGTLLAVSRQCMVYFEQQATRD